jgi:hypothetical protein
MSIADDYVEKLRTDGFITAEPEVAESDDESGEPMVYGYRIVKPISPIVFQEMKRYLDFISNGMDWWVKTSEVDTLTIIDNDGGIAQVGLGPSGGFKWVVLKSGRRFSHRLFRVESQKWAAMNPRRVARCDRNGNDTRIPAAVSRAKC